MIDADTIADRQAVLCGPSAIAARQAEKYRHARLAAAARERDQRLVAAIRHHERGYA